MKEEFSLQETAQILSFFELDFLNHHHSSDLK